MMKIGVPILALSLFFKVALVSCSIFPIVSFRAYV